MRSSNTITLFSPPPQRESGPSAFVVSIVLHSCVFALLFASVRQVRVLEQKMPNRKFDVRLLDMRQAQSSLQWFPQQRMTHSGHAAVRHGLSAGGKLGSARVSRVAHVSRNFISPKPAPQTMIQPEVPPDQRVLPKIPIPKAMVWTPGEIAQRKIVTPAPQPPGAIQVKPSLAQPNHEMNPANVTLSSTPFETKAPLPVPGTTSPVNVSGPQPAKQLPQTSSLETTQVSPARVISLSDTNLQNGTAALPVVNEVAPSDSSGSPTAGKTESVSIAGSDDTDSRENGTGAGHGAGNAGDNADGFTVSYGSNTGPSDDNVASIDTGEGPSSSSGTSAAPAHLTKPKDGHYGMVVVGASPEEDYPETADLWTGRLAYTVYLQTETPQSWILQYSLSREVGDDPGNGSQPDPPWPYDMIRPNLSSIKDVILVHGFVNAQGRFEQLSVAYPPGFVETSLLLRALKQWVFRPAMSQGQPATVEILLIIPGGAGG